MRNAKWSEMIEKISKFVPWKQSLVWLIISTLLNNSWMLDKMDDFNVFDGHHFVQSTIGPAGGEAKNKEWLSVSSGRPIKHVRK